MFHIQHEDGAAAGRRSLAAGLLFLCLYVLTIPLGNWVVMNIGLVCPAQGQPCLVPVWPGVMAPSGVMVAGAALVLRDGVHHYLGVKAAFAAILAGALLSGFLSPASLIFASTAAFLFSETVDLLVYQPLRGRYPSSAILASGLAGAMADSALFLFFAFGSLEFFWGQVIGKLWMSVAAAAVLFALHQRAGRSSAHAAA
ncbi:VUT family protein [Mesosutterella sp. OilRF-GAM-744-9]|uniref:VUT family protein n=1 Tax=Mesosutterella porci TaxID=2915351 RepID=A0ABS9MPY6_9BURK|nr:VUT family protein [Mesosutterella sp. oilRF-744-WT-GAM-9]MCG5030330.1 VUT family protein [Mesosutterella sp. oilRF-744-WT-GAM-9]MCI6530600.1 VUT family protein [Mesosutterella sp.]